MVVEDPDRPFLTRGLRVPDRVAAHLLGDDAPDPALTGVLLEVGPYATALSDQLGRALAAGVGLVHLREKVAGSGSAAAVSALWRRRVGGRWWSTWSGWPACRNRVRSWRWPCARPCCAAPGWWPSRSRRWRRSGWTSCSG